MAASTLNHYSRILSLQIGNEACTGTVTDRARWAVHASLNPKSKSCLNSLNAIFVQIFLWNQPIYHNASAQNESHPFLPAPPFMMHQIVASLVETTHRKPFCFYIGHVKLQPSLDLNGRGLWFSLGIESQGLQLADQFVDLNHLGNLLRQ